MYSFVAIRDMFSMPPSYQQCPVFGKRGRPKPCLPLLRVFVIMANYGLRRYYAIPIATWLLHLNAHEERVARIGWRRNDKSRLAINWCIKGYVDVVG